MIKHRYHFRDIASYSLDVAIFSTASVFDAPVGDKLSPTGVLTRHLTVENWSL